MVMVISHGRFFFPELSLLFRLQSWENIKSNIISNSAHWEEWRVCSSRLLLLAFDLYLIQCLEKFLILCVIFFLFYVLFFFFTLLVWLRSKLQSTISFTLLWLFEILCLIKLGETLSGISNTIGYSRKQWLIKKILGGYLKVIAEATNLRGCLTVKPPRHKLSIYYNLNLKALPWQCYFLCTRV